VSSVSMQSFSTLDIPLSSALKSVFGLVNGRINHWIKKASDCLALCNARCKVECELDVELHGMDSDCELMARQNARRETWGMAKIRVREAVHEVSVNINYLYFTPFN